MSISAKRSHLPIILTATFIEQNKSDSPGLVCSAEKLIGVVQRKSCRGVSSLDFQ